LYPLLSGELTVRVCVGSGEDDVDQILGGLAAGKFSVMVRVGKGKIVVCDRDGPDGAKIVAGPSASAKAEEGRTNHRRSDKQLQSGGGTTIAQKASHKR
jgi:hypothetical protein